MGERKNARNEEFQSFMIGRTTAVAEPAVGFSAEVAE